MVRFEALKRRFIISCIIKLMSPLHIGAGRGRKEYGEPDLPILKTPEGEPYIPGSSLKGVLRSEAERILRGHGIRICIYEKHEREIVPDYDCTPDNPCPSCEIFGSRNMASRILISDALLEDESKEKGKITAERPGVALYRDTRTIAPGRGPFYIEYVPSGVKFRFEIVFENPEDWMLGLIFTALEAIRYVGGQVSRGMGRVEIKVEKAEVWTAKSIIEQQPEMVYDGMKLKDFIEQCKSAFKKWLEEARVKYG